MSDKEQKAAEKRLSSISGNGIGVGVALGAAFGAAYGSGVRERFSILNQLGLAKVAVD